MNSTLPTGDLIRQFLREVSKYLTYWNLYCLAAENAKTRQQPWDGGILTIQPSEAQLDKMVELHDEHLDWGVKLESTGQALAKSLLTVGHDEAAKAVLALIHRARGGGGGAPKVFPIWESTKVELQRVALIESSKNSTSDSSQADSKSRAADSESPADESPSDPTTTLCSDPITIEDFAELSGVAERTIRNRPAASRPQPTVKSGGQNKFVYSYAEMRSWASREFPACVCRLPEDYSGALEVLLEMRRNNRP